MSFSLTIKIAPKWVDYFEKNQWQFCFARTAQSVGKGRTMDVIAYCDDVASNIDVHWKNTYTMRASKTGFAAGSRVTVSTDPLPIKFGQSFTLPNWANPSVADDDAAPADGFIFRNTPSAAAVLYQVINDKTTPVYITPESVLPPNARETLIPQISVAVWFQRDVETEYMFDQASVYPFVVPMTTPKMTVHYNEAGQWVVMTETVDYTLGKFAKSHGLVKGAIDGQEAPNGFPQKALEYRAS